MTPCPECDKDWSRCTDYYVLGIHLEDIFLDPVTTNAHLAHWREHYDWFGGKQHDVNYKKKKKNIQMYVDGATTVLNYSTVASIT